jgi:hypothetical protein
VLAGSGPAGDLGSLNPSHDIIIKPVHDITQRDHRLLGTHPIPPTNKEEEYMAKSN